MTLESMTDEERRAAMRLLAVPLSGLMRGEDGRLLTVALSDGSPVRALLKRMANADPEAVCRAAAVLTGAVQTDPDEAMDQLLLCADEELVRFAFLCGRFGAGHVLRGLEAACAVHVRELEALLDGGAYGQTLPDPARFQGMNEGMLRARVLSSLRGCGKDGDGRG